MGLKNICAEVRISTHICRDNMWLVNNVSEMEMTCDDGVMFLVQQNGVKMRINQLNGDFMTGRTVST